jgi:hypothetical protein
MGGGMKAEEIGEQKFGSGLSTVNQNEHCCDAMESCRRMLSGTCFSTAHIISQGIPKHDYLRNDQWAIAEREKHISRRVHSTTTTSLISMYSK